MNVLCLRRYTMELRLAGIRDGWQTHNLKFNDKRDLLVVPSFSATETEQQVSEWLSRTPAKNLPTAFLVGAISWPQAPLARCKSMACGCRRMSR